MKKHIYRLLTWALMYLSELFDWLGVLTIHAACWTDDRATRYSATCKCGDPQCLAGTQTHSDDIGI